MNIERMRTLADRLDGVPRVPGERERADDMDYVLPGKMKWFDMDMWSSGCGTAGCVAGWACELFEDDESRRRASRIAGVTESILWRARKLLGLTREEAHLLFTPSFSEDRETNVRVYDNLGGGDAAKALRKAAFGYPMREWWDHVTVDAEEPAVDEAEAGKAAEIEEAVA